MRYHPNNHSPNFLAESITRRWHRLHIHGRGTAVSQPLFLLFLLVLTPGVPHCKIAEAAEPGLVGWWRLSSDGRDESGEGRDAAPSSGAVFERGERASLRLVGESAKLEVIDSTGLRPGAGDFSVSLWAHLDEALEGDPGDLLSLYDRNRRVGFSLGVRSNTGVTSNQANIRQLQFGIDAGTEPKWMDVGRPGETVLPFALAVHDGRLYVGSAGNQVGNTGKVFRLEGPGKWEDLGSPDGSNAVSAFAVHGGKLYAGTAKYRFGGSSLTESLNTVPGGAIFRLGPDDRWQSVGRLPNREAIGGLVVFSGRLHASSLYKPAGFFRLEDDGRWKELPLPGGRSRVEPLAVFEGALYAGSYDGGHVYRYDGESWSDLGVVGDNTQTYSFAILEGSLCVGTWPSGRVYRMVKRNSHGDTSWEDMGRMGEELEVMGLMLHNGKLYGGTLPLAAVYRFDGGTRWTSTGRLDLTPDLKYRRAWTMAEFQGRLYCGAMPSGHIWAMEAGRVVTYDRPLTPGWRHIAAVRTGSELKLYVDGERVATSPATIGHPRENLVLDPSVPLRIGGGPGGRWKGKLSDVRLYHRALEPAEVKGLAK